MSDVDSLLEYNEIVMKMFNSEDEGFQFYNTTLMRRDLV
jgi:hypothetical protein